MMRQHLLIHLRENQLVFGSTATQEKKDAQESRESSGSIQEKQEKQGKFE